MINASSRPGAVVLDCFMGGGSTGEACRNTGRGFIGIEADLNWFRSAQRRIAAARESMPLLNTQ